MDEETSPHADDDHEYSCDSPDDSWHENVPLTSTKSSIKSKAVSKAPSICTYLGEMKDIV